MAPKPKAAVSAKSSPAGAGAAAASHLRGEAKSKSVPEAKAKVAPKAKPEPKAKAEAKAEPKSKAAAKPEPKAKGEPKAKPAAKSAAATTGPSPEEEERLKAEEEARVREEEAKAKAEEEEARQKEELERKQKEEAEAEIKRLQALADGEVTIKYSMYAEKFPIKAHTLTAATIDELYCLSDVMPGCFIHLSEREILYGEDHVYVREDPSGTFKGLMAGETYWCYVQQDPEQEKADQDKMRKQFAGGVATGLGDRGAEGEHCSCGDGAPCTDSSICKDWNNRFANALKAGGNPILFT